MYCLVLLLKSFVLYDTDISPLVAKCDDPNAMEDKDVAEVVRLLDKACRDAGFFYVVISYPCFIRFLIF